MNPFLKDMIYLSPIKFTKEEIDFLIDTIDGIKTKSNINKIKKIEMKLEALKENL